jgi:hypothetical protein
MNSSPTYTVTSNSLTAGSVLTTNGTGASAWATLTADPNLQGKTLHVNGNATITGELSVQGVNLAERLDSIEHRLGILRPNEELEEKWDNLRALGQAYRELEKEILEKQEMWAILKK